LCCTAEIPRPLVVVVVIESVIGVVPILDDDHDHDNDNDNDNDNDPRPSRNLCTSSLDSSLASDRAMTTLDHRRSTMASFADLIGAFMQSAMTQSGGARVGSVLDELQRGGLGGLGGGASTGASGLPGDLLAGVLDAVKGGLGGSGRNPGQPGGIGDVLGSLLGGGQSGTAGASRGLAQGGMLAVLAGVAMKALSSAGQDAQGAGLGSGAGSTAGGGFGGFPGALGAALGGKQGPWSGGEVPIGMRVPRNTAEQEALESTAQLVLKGMINAAKSDGQISPSEMQRIVGKLHETGVDQGAQQWVLQQMQEPLNVQAFAAEIPNQEVAAQVYAASLLAIEVDTDAERQYLQQLAQFAGLHPLVVGQIHQSLGVTA
jgi:uncharacterized membrane protein YebE (DUF533 family)